MNKNQKKYLSFTVKLIVSVAAFYYVFSKQDLPKIKELLINSDIFWFALGTILFALSKVIGAYRLNSFYNAIELNISNKTNLKLYWLGLLYNNFLPGGIGGDGYKIYWINKYKSDNKLKSIASATILDRVNGLLTIFVLIFVLIPFGTWEHELFNYTFLLIPLAYGSYYLALKLFFKSFTKNVVVTSIYSIALQIVQLLSIHCFLIAIGVDYQYLDHWILFLIATVSFAIPVTLSGFGSREFMYNQTSSLYGIDPEIGSAISLLFYISRMAGSLPGLYFVFRPESLTSE